MKVSGFSIIRNGEKFAYPFVESIQSLLPLVDEFVLAVGQSDDRTLEIARAIDSPKLRIIETVWNDNLRRGGLIMAQQTNLALDHCTGDWCFYLQADEVIHEDEHATIRTAMEHYLPRRRVEGLSFRYRHFFGSYNLVNPLRYRRQIRIVRRGIGVRSVGDACGFGIGNRKLRSAQTGAQMFHYGWVRNPIVHHIRVTDFEQWYQGKASGPTPPPPAEATADYYETAACVKFTGTHPSVMQPVIAQQDWPEPEYAYIPAWRNRVWWRRFFRKNFRSIHRRLKTRRERKLQPTLERNQAA